MINTQHTRLKEFLAMHSNLIFSIEIKGNSYLISIYDKYDLEKHAVATMIADDLFENFDEHIYILLDKLK